MILYTLSTCAFVSFFVLALKWNELMRKWETLAIKVPTFPTVKQKKRYVFELRLIMFIIFLMASSMITEMLVKWN